MDNRFVPSIYQRAIFEWVVNGKGDCVVMAAAGSGKTKTLVEAAKLIDSDNAVFVAFNRHIVQELQQRLGNKMTVKTVHSIGCSVVRSHLGRAIVDDTKYADIAKPYAQEIADDLNRDYRERVRRSRNNDDDKPQEPPSASQVLSQLKSLAHFCRVTLTPPDKYDLLEEMVDHFGCLDLDISLKQLQYPLVEILRAGEYVAIKEGSIDYDDMLWLPYRWDLYPAKSGFLLVDEAQDINPAQLDLILKMRARGGRTMWVGDKFQAIYGFSGAMNDSLDRIIATTRATTLPLSICYRCPVSHIRLAQEIVPSIEAAPNAIDGTVEYIPYEKVHETVRSGDLVIARCTAPVVKLCIELIQRRISARVRGKDIGKSLTAIVKDVAKMPGYTWANFGKCLEEYKNTRIYKLLQKKGGEAQVESLRDRIQGIWVCYTSFNARSIEQLCAEIEDLFSSEQAAVILSTVHRCVTPDTLVETPTGLLPIGRLKNQGEIATPNGIKKYTQRFDIEKGKVLKIKTKSGYSITVTPDHGLTSWVKDSWTRVRAGDLKVGDWLRLKLGATVNIQKNVDLPPPPIPRHTATAYAFPEVLNEDLAELFGLIVADGTIYKRGIRLAKCDRDVVERFKSLMELQFGAKAHDVPYGMHSNAYAAEVNSVQIAAWLLSIGGMAPNNKSIPPCILQSHLKVQAAFLRGLFEDGGVNFRGNYIDHICLVNCNPTLTQTVQTMLLRFGIISSATCRKSQRFHGALYIFGYHAQKFSELIGFVSERKNNQLINGLYAEERMYSVPLSKDCISKLIPYLSARSVNNARWRGYLSRKTVRQAFTECGSNFLPELLEWHSERIVSIEEGESETVCVEVPDGSRFLQNGFDGWNSKGLESDRVFILRPDQLPLKWKGQLDWQFRQEQNIAYVSKTRAKSALFFVTDDPPILDYGVSPTIDDDEDEEDIYF